MTFQLIKKDGPLSSKALGDELNEIRDDLTPSLGRDHGRVVLKKDKPQLDERPGGVPQKTKCLSGESSRRATERIRAPGSW